MPLLQGRRPLDGGKTDKSPPPSATASRLAQSFYARSMWRSLDPLGVGINVKPVPRKAAARVTPAASAARTASSVGEDAAAMTGAPARADFKTISTEHRLVRQIAPADMSWPSRINAPISLSSALWRPMSSRTATRAPVRLIHPAA